MSPWEKIPLGEKAPEVINVIIEIPKGSQNKYEFDEELGIFKFDRVLYARITIRLITVLFRRRAQKMATILMRS